MKLNNILFIVDDNLWDLFDCVDETFRGTNLVSWTRNAIDNYMSRRTGK